MKVLKKKRLTVVTIVYWFMLVYIIAALVWWFIALEKQNRQMTNYKLSELSPGDTDFIQRRAAIMNESKRKTTQFVSEGITFLALILIGAVFVYRVVRRQISLQHQQENFMMTITHELKTPIAITKLNLETLQKHQLDELTRQKLIQMTLEETNRLNNLASNILVSSQLEAGKYRMSKEELNFSDLVKSCVSNFQSRFPERTLNTEITPELEISGDPLLLQILVNNLLENAIKYSPNKTTVTCRLKKENNKIIFQVIDEGHSIPDIEKKKIFEKFYRIGSEQTRSAKGSGLGLYLCKKIAADHNASIGVKDNHPSGSNFTVSFGQ